MVTRALSINHQRLTKVRQITDRVYNEAEVRIFEETLTDTVPNLYFERVDWLAMALKDAGVSVTSAQIMEIQDNLFSTYMGNSLRAFPD